MQGRAQNANGNGAWSHWATLTAGAPGEPGRPGLTTRFWDLTATWDAPGDSGSAITGYDIQYLNVMTIPKDGNGNRSIPDDQDGVSGFDRLPWKDWQPDTVSTARSATIDGLLPGYPYWVRVRAVNTHGDGAWSEYTSRHTFYPVPQNRTKACDKNSTTALPLAWSCEIKTGVGGVTTFASSAVTTGTDIIKPSPRNEADEAEFIAFNPEGGSATVTTYDADNAVVDTFNISVTPFSIGSATPSPANPAAGGTFTVNVSLISPFSHTHNEQILDSNFEPIEGLYSRSWVKLVLPTGWTGTDRSGASVNEPVMVLGYNAISVSFTVTVASTETAGSKTIRVEARTRDVLESCATNPNCYQDLKHDDFLNLGVTVASQMMGMAVVATEGADATAPDAVAATLVAGPHMARAMWEAPDSPAAPITAYEVRYRRSPNGAWSLWATLGADARHADVTGLEAGATYEVAVRAQNAFGWSEDQSPIPSITLPAAQPPGAPASVTVTRGADALTATWPAVAGATGYNVVYTTDGKRSWHRAHTNVAATSAVIANATASAYHVAVQALNAAGASPWTDSALVPALHPAAPSVVSGTRSGATLTASWSAVAGATGYNVVYTCDGKQSWHRAHTNVSGTSAAIALTGAHADTGCHVAVQAVNSAGAGPWTDSPLIPAPAKEKAGVGTN